MTDEHVEQLLARQRLASPSPSLRARVLTAAAQQRPVVTLGSFDYAVAAVAAGLLLVAAGMETPALPRSVAAERQQQVADVAAALGGGSDATAYAELVVSRREESDRAQTDRQANPFQEEVQSW